MLCSSLVTLISPVIHHQQRTRKRNSGTKPNTQVKVNHGLWSALPPLLVIFLWKVSKQTGVLVLKCKCQPFTLQPAVLAVLIQRRIASHIKWSIQFIWKQVIYVYFLSIFETIYLIQLQFLISLVTDLPADFVQSWKNLTPRAELRLPTSNDYIATDFNLKPVNPVLAKEVSLDNILTSIFPNPYGDVLW